MPQTATHINQLGRVIIPVADQDRSLEFYTDKLGFEKRGDTPYGDGDRWVEVAPPGADRLAGELASADRDVGRRGQLQLPDRFRLELALDASPRA